MESQSLNKIVVAYDFSETAKLALDRALELAIEHRSPAEIHTVVVVDDGTGGLPLRSRAVDSIQHQVETARALLTDEVRAARNAKLDGLAEPPELTCTVHVRLGDPTWHITSLAVEIGAEMIVVGTHGRRGVRRLLLGSVAERVVRTAPCPVLVVRPIDRAAMEAVPRPEPADPNASTEPPPEAHRYSYSSVLEPHGPRNHML